MKSETYDVYEIDFKKEVINGKVTGNIIAVGFHGGKGAAQPFILSRGKTKGEAFQKAKIIIKQEREEVDSRPEPYYQYRRNFGL